MSTTGGRELINVSVRPEVAAFFRSLPKRRKEAMEMVLARTLESAMASKSDELLQLLDKARKEATDKGLSPKKLQRILEKD